MAFADGHFDHTEDEVILKKMSRLFPSNPDNQAKFEEFKQDYRSLSPEDVDDLIKHNFDNFSHVSFSDKYKVYREMYDVINADGVIDESETIAMDKLKDIIEYSVKQ